MADTYLDIPKHIKGYLDARASDIGLNIDFKTYSGANFRSAESEGARGSIKSNTAFIQMSGGGDSDASCKIDYPELAIFVIGSESAYKDSVEIKGILHRLGSMWFSADTLLSWDEASDLEGFDPSGNGLSHSYLVSCLQRGQPQRLYLRGEERIVYYLSFSLTVQLSSSIIDNRQD